MSKGVVISEIYRDTGCYLYPSCLECPFPDCLLDTYPLVLSELRRVEAETLAKQGKSVSEIAEVMGLSKRQVKRYLHDVLPLTT